MGIETPKNINDTVTIVLETMSSNQKNQLLHIREEDLINLHFDFGMWVRNLLGHWVPPIVEGEYPAHPDNISSEITELIWKKLQKTK